VPPVISSRFMILNITGLLKKMKVLTSLIMQNQ